MIQRYARKTFKTNCRDTRKGYVCKFDFSPKSLKLYYISL